jgi:hypothetical protein
MAASWKTLIIVAALCCAAPGAVRAEDRAPQRGRGRRSAGRSADQTEGPRPLPFWASIPVGLGLGAAVLPLSPVYAALAAGAVQAPQTRVFLGRVGSAIKRSLNRGAAEPEGEPVTLRTAVRALNSLTLRLVDDLDAVPAFVVVNASGAPLQIGFAADPSCNFTFAYLEFADAFALVQRVKAPEGEEEAAPLKVVGCARRARRARARSRMRAPQRRGGLCVCH